MEVSSSYEKEQQKSMDAAAYFNRIYTDTYPDILKFIIIKTSNADQVEDILQNVYQSFYARISKKGFDDIMADVSSHMIAIFNGRPGATRHAVKYAQKNGLEIAPINPRDISRTTYILPEPDDR